MSSPAEPSVHGRKRRLGRRWWWLALIACGAVAWLWLGRLPSRSLPVPEGVAGHVALGAAERGEPAPDRPIDLASPLAAADMAADEVEAMAAIEQALASGHAQQALTLILQADSRFGEQVAARRALEIDAYVKLGRVGHARTLADQFYRRFPLDSHARHIERLTGYHPRP